ncbi:flagellar basal body-associated FliL family protein [Konateibacter massiliensis]|uniref:flagellar basal body-associated FliL family protein n=1 Tax=Konateibacter massiliensis TaxID=2002841 RepID=UPI000C14E046|nr:flagellar basal body-associated FliL family protein [Konateibacter massiliensis]
MKKNIFSIVILALVIVNLVLTAIMMFSVVPSANKTNTLITQVSTALNLELQAKKAQAGGEIIPIEQIETYDIADTITVNLKKDTDGGDHFAVFSITLSMNSKSDEYAEYGESVAAKESLIKSKIIDVVSSYTMEQIQTDRAGVLDSIEQRLNEMFDADLFIDVAFRDIVLQ